MNNKISIALATYNGEKFLSQQLDSLLNQTYQNIEIIICDDNSTDNTINVIENYIKKYSNIILYKNKKQLGFVKNFEKVIKLCKSEYIALCDQDDIWIKNKLEVQIQEMKLLEKMYKNRPLLVHSDLKMINENEKIIHSSYFKFRNYRLKNKKDLAYILGACSVMGNTILFNQLLKNKILPFIEDIEVHDYWIALVNELYGKRKTIYEALVLYRIHHKNSSNNKDTLQQIKRTKEINLPYHNINRDKLLKEIMYNFTLSTKDKNLINDFLIYLEFKNHKLIIIYILLKHNFMKKGFFFKIKIFIKILLKKRE